MHVRVISIGLIALSLAACGDSGDTADVTPSVAGAGEVSATSKATPRAKAKAQAKERAAAKAGDELFLAAAITQETRRTPAVVLLPDTNNAADALAEAKKLSRLGIASMVVEGPSSAPTDAAAFNAAVEQARAAIAKLRGRNDVDPVRIGVIGEGIGAHVAAVAIGRQPEAVAAAVLADVGGVVVPSPKFAPERWLERARGTQILFQRDQDARAMTDEEARRLLLAAPPGTLLENYKSLDIAAEAARDSWIKVKLVSN